MAGIYIHIPFCKKACNYCNFHFSTLIENASSVIAAISEEADLRNTYINAPIHTIYFGGGTPSIIDISQLEIVFNSLHKNFSIAGNAEITLECNPDDITNEKLEAWKQLGVNRLSIGVQSFYDEDLKWMNRAHKATQAVQAIEYAQSAGFDNITIDLIYGTPTLDDQKWLNNLEKANSFNVQHLSCYALAVEPKTALHHMIESCAVAPVDPEQQSRQFDLLMDFAQQNGYEHYEISNFAKPGYRSRHNTSYWQGIPYIGLGPGAHSFNGSSRQWNISNNAIYVKKISNKELPFEFELLTPNQKLNEYLMTSLRTIEGLEKAKIESMFGAEMLSTIKKSVAKYIETNMLTETDESFRLTDKGKHFADGIAGDLFQV